MRNNTPLRTSPRKPPRLQLQALDSVERAAGLERADLLEVLALEPEPKLRLRSPVPTPMRGAGTGTGRRSSADSEELLTTGVRCTNGRMSSRAAATEARVNGGEVEGSAIFGRCDFTPGFALCEMRATCSTTRKSKRTQIE